MNDDVLMVDSGTGPRRVRLGDYLNAAAEEHAIAAEYTWIKRLRQLDVEGQPLRRRFTLRGDSLWWFAELYLHKHQVVLGLLRTIAALDHLIERERPVEIRVEGRHPLLRGLAPQAARVHGIRYRGAGGFGGSRMRIMRMDLRARGLTLAAKASRARTRTAPAGDGSTRIAAFVHRAFWRSDASKGSGESYIGPVLGALEGRLGNAVTYVGVGPAENFRARRWWHVLRQERGRNAAIPVESLAPLATLRDSLRVWGDRHATRRALWNSTDVRQHAVIRGYDCWPAIREELAGIALLQWPWSARAMDEAGAALDALRPAVA
jgi:hypothetical protein